MKHIIILVTSMAILFFSCHKDCDFVGTYVFELPATLSPAKDTFRIGDTITISSSFPDMVFERKTNKQYKLEGWNFFPGTRIVKIDDTTSLTDNFSEFDYSVDPEFDYELFFYSNGDQSLVGQYKYENNYYQLKYIIIPKKKGLYMLKQGSRLYEFGSNQTFDGECPKRKAGLDAAVKLNDGADNNIHMLSSSPDPHYHDWVLQKPDDRFHKFGGYCFYVKD